MATIQKRSNSYLIRVSCGYDSKGKQVIQSTTWKPEPNMTPRQIEKELNRQAVMFEEKCLKGYQGKAIKFEEFAEQWFSVRIKIVHFKQTNDMSRKPSTRNERSEWRALGFGA